MKDKELKDLSYKDKLIKEYTVRELLKLLIDDSEMRIELEFHEKAVIEFWWFCKRAEYKCNKED